MVAIPQSGLLAQVSSLRLPSGHSGQILTLSNAARASLPRPLLLMVDAGVCAASPLGELLLGTQSVGFNYLFIFHPSYVTLCGSKAHHRLSRESVSWCLETALFLILPSQDGALSLPLLSLFFVFYIFSYLLSKTMGCFSGCLMSSAGIQKLFCGIYSAFKCSFDEFVGEKVVSLSYPSTILVPSSTQIFFLIFIFTLFYFTILYWFCPTLT